MANYRDNLEGQKCLYLELAATCRQSSPDMSREFQARAEAIKTACCVLDKLECAMDVLIKLPNHEIGAVKVACESLRETIQTGCL